jgi:hypothetical protein
MSNNATKKKDTKHWIPQCLGERRANVQSIVDLRQTCEAECKERTKKNEEAAAGLTASGASTLELAALCFA